MRQSCSFIFDITDSPLILTEDINQIIVLNKRKETNFVRSIILKKRGECIIFLKIKNECDRAGSQHDHTHYI